MIGVTKLLCGKVTPSDALRYGRRSDRSPSHLLQFTHDKKPIVVWNSTKACNLRCIHCYYTANAQPDPDELTSGEARAMIDDLAAFGVPVLLFSGGEPLCRCGRGLGCRGRLVRSLRRSSGRVSGHCHWGDSVSASSSASESQRASIV